MTFITKCLGNCKKVFENERIDFLFGTVRKERVMQGFWPNKIRWKFNIYPFTLGAFITRLVMQKNWLLQFKIKYSSQVVEIDI